jgi:hypothetical protein
MAAGFPVKADYATGDVLSAANMNDLSGTLNYIDPTGETNGYVLTRNSGATGGLEWAAAGTGGGLTLLQTLTLSGSSTTSSSISSAYKNIVVHVKNAYGNILEDMTLRFNSDTGSNYYWQNINGVGGSAGAGGAAADSKIYFALLNDTSTIGKQTNGSFRIYNYTATDTVYYESTSFARDNSNNRHITTAGIYDNSAAISTITFLASSATFTAGTAYIYGES